eukprot:CCRYP_015411-RF/>CCRYP_015411-RF protein AED:0.48 eAED:0.93 QI:0/0/0/1/0/0/2/0/72
MFLMHCIHIPPTTLVKKQPNNILMSRSFPRQQMKRCGTQSIRHGGYSSSAASSSSLYRSTGSRPMGGQYCEW